MKSFVAAKVIFVLTCIHIQFDVGYCQTNNGTNYTDISDNGTTTTESITTMNNIVSNFTTPAEPENITTGTSPLPEPHTSPMTSNETSTPPEPSSTSTVGPISSPTPEPTMSSTPEPSTTSEPSSTTMSKLEPSSTMSTSTMRSTMKSTMRSTMKSTMESTMKTHEKSTPIAASQTCQDSPFGTSGLAAFAILLAICILEAIVILVLIFYKRCKSQLYTYDTEKAEKNATGSGFPMHMPVDAGFGGIQTVDLDSDHDLRSGDGKIGNGSGKVTTFGSKTNTLEQPGQPSNGAEQPSWLKVEPSSPEAGDQSNDIIPSIPDTEREISQGNGGNEDKTPIQNTDGATVPEMDSEPLLPAPPPELDIDKGETSSLSENSSAGSNNELTEM